jgi:ParB-like nuclease domain
VVERITKYPAPVGSRPSIEWVATADLSVDETYQRRTDNQASQRLIGSIAARFDWRLFGVVTVSRRPDGTLKVIDGQHRWSAARLRGDIDQVPCCLSRFATTEEEAKFFVQANRSRKPMNRLDDFHAALAAGDDEALQVQQLVIDAGLSVSRSTSSAGWKEGEVAFTGSTATALRKHGSPIVSAALTNLAEAFPEARLTHGGSIFLGMIKVLASPPTDFDPDAFFQALLTFDADQWGDFVSGLKGGDTRASAMRSAMLEAYGEVLARQAVVEPQTEMAA